MREAGFSVRLDVRNPGQFFACCGLLELAGRLDPLAEGYFDNQNGVFSLSIIQPGDVIRELGACSISGLTPEQQKEREKLESEKRKLRKTRAELPSNLEERRIELGTIARKGAVALGAPFHLTLNWWQASDEDSATPKTWAGLQEIHKIARAAQDALSGAADAVRLFDHACVLRKPREYWKKDGDQNHSVEPFYFDSRRFAHALDAGWSLDVQEMEAAAHPAVELLSLIGIQRFRPRPSAQKRQFEYSTWMLPLSSPVAAAVAGGSVPMLFGETYRFGLKFRDDQKRLKAFGYANRIGGE